MVRIMSEIYILGKGKYKLRLWINSLLCYPQLIYLDHEDTYKESYFNEQSGRIRDEMTGKGNYSGKKF